MRRCSLLALLGALACNEPDLGPPPVVVDPELEGMVEVVACRQSHEHELRHVEVFADPQSAVLFQDCVLEQEACEPFPIDSLFVKREYEFPGCLSEDLVSYTSNRKLEMGSFADGYDWHWQRQDADLRVVEDGAPVLCIACHVNHCSAPDGWDMHCIPD